MNRRKLIPGDIFRFDNKNIVMLVGRATATQPVTYDVRFTDVDTTRYVFLVTNEHNVANWIEERVDENDFFDHLEEATYLCNISAMFLSITNSKELDSAVSTKFREEYEEKDF